MSSRSMKMDEIKARAQAAFEKSEERKRESLLAWQAQEEEGHQLRQKTERLRALRLAKEAAEAAAPVVAKAPAKRVVRRIVKG